MIFRINIASPFIASFIWLSLLFAKKHVNMTGCLSARLISEARQLSSSTPLKLDISNIRSLKLKFTNIKCSSNNCLILFSAQDVMARTNDYTHAEDQGGYFGKCFEIFAILLKTIAKISMLIFNQCVVMCLIVPAIKSWSENNDRDFNDTTYYNYSRASYVCPSTVPNYL